MSDDPIRPVSYSVNRPYRGMRGNFVVEQQDPHTGVWLVVVGALTELAARGKAKTYPGNTRVTPNHPGDPMREGSYRP